MTRSPTTVTQPLQSGEAHLLAWLSGREVMCPACGYNLKDLKKPACPECGAPLELTVASPRLNPGPWIASMIFVALGAGFDSVVTVLVVGAMILSPPRAPAEWMQAWVIFVTFLVLTSACTGVLAWMYRSRRRWVYWSRRWCIAVAWASFLITGLVHGLVGLVLMRMLS
jgi:hypothetical protein